MTSSSQVGEDVLESANVPNLADFSANLFKGFACDCLRARFPELNAATQRATES